MSPTDPTPASLREAGYANLTCIEPWPTPKVAATVPRLIREAKGCRGARPQGLQALRAPGARSPPGVGPLTGEDLSPLLSFIRDELAEVGRRAWQHRWRSVGGVASSMMPRPAR